jgi:hypothetical protein
MIENKNKEQEDDRDIPPGKAGIESSARRNALLTEEHKTVDQKNIQPSTTNNQPPTKIMEVHHPHHVTHKKKWGEYLLEFLMLFLAVFLGFVAENMREHSIERSREKRYMYSLVEELKFDTANYQKVINEINLVNPALDSAYTNVKEAKRFNNIMLGKWQYIINRVNIQYQPGLPTIQQMQSSGNLRLIENHMVEKKILAYQALVKGNLERGNLNVYDASVRVYAFEDAYCDYTNFRKGEDADNHAKSESNGFSTYSMGLLEKDPIKLNEFANSFINFKANNTGYIRHVLNANKLATELIVLINKEYHLENE